MEQRGIANLKQKITDAIATVDEGMLQRTWQEIEYRRAHIEVY